MAHYMFETDWVLTAPVDEVYETLSRPEVFGDWWPSVVSSKTLAEGDHSGLGKRVEYTIRSPLVYAMTFDVKAIEAERPTRIHTVVRGDLIGTGTYLLEQRPGETHVRFNWYVSTTRRWMNLAAPVARPLFAWAHDRVMQEGCRALARHLGARLVSAKTRLVEKPTAQEIPVTTQDS